MAEEQKHNCKSRSPQPVVQVNKGTMQLRNSTTKDSTMLFVAKKQNMRMTYDRFCYSKNQYLFTLWKT